MMLYRRMIDGERSKIIESRSVFEKEFGFVERICNYLLALPHLTGQLCDESDENSVKIQDVFILYIYEVPFKLRSIYKLLEMANYSDAAILLRTLVETTLIYKSYISNNDGDGLSQYILRHKTTIRSIFEKVLPGYYESIYSSLCNFTHGNVFDQMIFRANVRDHDLSTKIDNINSKWFYYVSNQAISIVPCILDMYEDVFPNNSVSKDETMVAEKEYIVKVISNFIDTMIEKDTDKKTFYWYYKELLSK